MSLPNKQKKQDGDIPKMDDVLRRMLSTPPQPHKKPTKKQAKETAK